ncbi:MAG: ribonuclease E/G [Pseudomonadota bacterium]
MTAQLSHILYERTPGWLRAVAFARDGRPWHLFQQAWSGEGEAVRAGQIVEARVRARADGGGGVFLDHIGWKRLEGGFEALFCDRKHAEGLHEGMTLQVRVLSAARRDHAAKITPVESGEAFSDPSMGFHDWMERLGVQRVEEVQGVQTEIIQAAFDESLTHTVPLVSGGVLHIERTRAMTAFDVDAAGREGRGSAGAKALALNKVAVAEAARQMCLRGLGGVMAVDCVEPLNEGARSIVRDACVDAFTVHDPRTAKVLKPSAFGILEAAIAWQDTPIDEVFSRSETGLLLELCLAQRALRADTGGFYTLGLGEAVYEAYLKRKGIADAEISAHFQGRLKLGRADGRQEGLRRQ